MANCWNPLETVSCVVSTAVDNGAANLGDAMMGAWDGLMKSFLTSWLNVGILVNLDGSSVTWLTDQLQVISVFLAVVGIMIACIWTMLHCRADKAVQVTQALFRVFLVTTLGTAVLQLGITATDAFSSWILANAGITVGGLSGQIEGVTAATIGPGLAIIAGIFGVIATLIQWIIMLVRATVLPLLAAVWPVSASGAMISGGEEMFSKVSKWILAFLLYKPIAAIIYAFAWRLKSGDDGIGGVINGMLLLVLAVAALPSMMKLIGPATAALGSAAGGTMAMAGGAAVVSAGVAVGAAVATGGASAGATAGAAGAAGSAGSAGSVGSAATASGSAAAAPTATSSQLPAPGIGGSGAAAGAGESPGAADVSGASGSSGAAPATGSASGGSSSGGAGVRAGVQSLGGSVAQGAKDSDGKDVIGS